MVLRAEHPTTGLPRPPQVWRAGDGKRPAATVESLSDNSINPNGELVNYDAGYAKMASTKEPIHIKPKSLPSANTKSTVLTRPQDSTLSVNIAYLQRVASDAAHLVHLYAETARTDAAMYTNKRDSKPAWTIPTESAAKRYEFEADSRWSGAGVVSGPQASIPNPSADAARLEQQASTRPTQSGINASFGSQHNATTVSSDQTTSAIKAPPSQVAPQGNSLSCFSDAGHGSCHSDITTPNANCSALIRRGRLPLACGFCRQHHLKCDEQLPCTNCRNRELECNLVGGLRSGSTRVACQHCRKFKIKCNETRPCDNCLKGKRECNSNPLDHRGRVDESHADGEVDVRHPQHGEPGDVGHPTAQTDMALDPFSGVRAEVSHSGYPSVAPFRESSLSSSRATPRAWVELTPEPMEVTKPTAKRHPPMAEDSTQQRDEGVVSRDGWKSRKQRRNLASGLAKSGASRQMTASAASQHTNGADFAVRAEDKSRNPGDDLAAETRLESPRTKRRKYKLLNRNQQSGLSLSCPYRKRNRKRFNYRDHETCTRPWEDISSLKQHILSQHQRHQCCRCQKRFSSLKELNNHLRCPLEQLCEVVHQSQTDDNVEDGVTIHLLKDDKICAWNDLWKVLFPNDRVIPSSEHEPCLLGELHEFEEIVREALVQAKQMVQNEIDQQSVHENSNKGRTMLIVESSLTRSLRGFMDRLLSEEEES
ncbi:hypothetical protein QBC46DRAFT_414429 [Diplogelasinospora grovesii]|uniref:Zn(2)-C6 fungal-type domain-containing protein n=1 Tax=Diplogelasinospora grovesii TaxID=303347 RepID=A0AAN6RXU0_9PEZI|nr:hypothetical protein QBC46DRAFT_414429 [Diplogelasinospora grovesii]